MMDDTAMGAVTVPTQDSEQISVDAFAERRRPSRRQHGRAARWTMLSVGVLLGVMAVVSAPLPVPLEVPLAGGSAVLILRASPRARRLYIHGSRRWPRPFRITDRMLRRRSQRAGQVGEKQAQS